MPKAPISNLFLLHTMRAAALFQIDDCNAISLL